jgi:glycopeptide antibiotics resistance protein
MNVNILKKLLILLPVFFFAANMVREIYLWELDTLGWRGYLEIALNILPLLLFASWDVFRRSSKIHAGKLVILSSFYFYLIAVFSLTIFSVPFRNFFVPFSWSDIIEYKSYYLRTVNLIPFKTIYQYGLFNMQVIGNLIMLMPLGIYVPMLFKKSAVNITLTLLAIATGIEFTQFLFSVIIPMPLHSVGYGRSTDIDDVILNFSGSILSFTLYRIVVQKYLTTFWEKLKKNGIRMLAEHLKS